jgi:hypothetical protein
MNDISQYFGNDIDVSPTGDLLVANSTVTGEQRVYRRLLTNPALDDRNGNPIASADYTFHPDYGAGIPRKVGRPADIDGTQSLIQSQMFKEAAVATSPAPKISVVLDGNLMSTVVRYIDAQSKEPVVLAFDIGQ